MPFFEISPNSKHVVFAADRDLLDKYELYSSSLVRRFNNGKLIENMRTKLNVDLLLDQGVKWTEVVISPDGSRVAYTAHQSNLHDLFSVPIVGPSSANVRLNHPKDGTIDPFWSG